MKANRLRTFLPFKRQFLDLKFLWLLRKNTFSLLFKSQITALIKDIGHLQGKMKGQKEEILRAERRVVEAVASANTKEEKENANTLNHVSPISFSPCKSLQPSVTAECLDTLAHTSTIQSLI